METLKKVIKYHLKGFVLASLIGVVFYFPQYLRSVRTSSGSCIVLCFPAEFIFIIPIVIAAGLCIVSLITFGAYYTSKTFTAKHVVNDALKSRFNILFAVCFLVGIMLPWSIDIIFRSLISQIVFQCLSVILAVVNLITAYQYREKSGAKIFPIISILLSVWMILIYGVTLFIPDLYQQ